MNWLASLLATAAAGFTLFHSKPERRGLAWLTLALMIFAGTWQAAAQFFEEQHKQEIERQAIGKLVFANNQFMDLLSEMIFASSGAWLPKTEAQFLSAPVAQLVCRELNMSAQAPELPAAAWWSYVARRTTAYKESLDRIRTDSGPYLDIRTLHLIDKVSQSVALAHWPEMANVHALNGERKWNLPPLLCWGLEQQIGESFAAVRELRSSVSKRAHELGVDDVHTWQHFPLPRLQSLQGRARFTPDSLAEWRRAYPRVMPIGYGTDPDRIPQAHSIGSAK